MEAFERLVEGVNEIVACLEQASMEPDPERADWAAVEPELRKLEALVQEGLIGPYSEAQSGIDEPALRDEIAGRVAGVLADAAHLLSLAGRSSAGVSLLSRAASMAPQGPLKEELRAVGSDPEHYALLVHARWLLVNDRQSEAEQVARRVVAGAQIEALVSGAKDILEAPRPISSAPSLGTLNGFGVGLYGRRDVHPDGSYVATTCLCAIFVPVFPLSSYRVTDEDGGGWSFYHKVPLSGFARGCRRAFAALVALMIGLTALSTYLDSGSRKAGIAIDEARATAAASQDPEVVLAAWESFVSLWGHSASTEALDEAGGEMAQLLLGMLPERIDLTTLEKTAAVTARARKLPLGRGTLARAAAASSKAGEGRKAIIARLIDAAERLGQDGLRERLAALTLIELARDLAPTQQRHKELGTRFSESRKALASSLAGDWPLEAADLYLDVGALDESLNVLEGLGDDPALRVDAANLIQRWIGAAVSVDEHDEARKRLGAVLAAAHEALENEGRKKLLEEPELGGLRAFLRHDPGDQQITVALADLFLEEERAAEARGLMAGLAPFGRLTFEGRRVLIGILASLGDQSTEEKLLDSYLALRVPRYQAVQRELNAAAERVWNGGIAILESGHYPGDLQEELAGVSREKGEQIVQEWLSRRVETDGRVKALRERAAFYEDVPFHCLELGVLKLSLAREGGSEQQRRLREAESAFLAIRDEASALPMYRLSLGQVYFRLGKTDEGLKEIESVLASKDPNLMLAAAVVFRELGLMDRARETAEEVAGLSDLAMSQAAAGMLAVMATTLDEEEAWLRKADQNSLQTRANLLSVRARKARAAGQLATAAALYGKAAEQFGKLGASDPASINNSALARIKQFSCDGNLAHLRRATDGLEGAVKLSPHNALLLGNLSYQLEYMAKLQTLEPLVNTQRLRPGYREAAFLLDALVDSPGRGEPVLQGYLKRPAHRRALEIARKMVIVSPQRIDAYGAAYASASLARNLAALEKLRDELKANPALDHGEQARARQQLRAGADDAASLKAIDGRIGDLDATIAEVAGKRNATRTVAAAHFLIAMRRKERVVFSRDLKDLDLAIVALEKAGEGWPELGWERSLAGALGLRVLLELASAHEGVERLLQEKLRFFGVGGLLHLVLQGTAGDEVVSALRARPEVARLASLMPALARGRPNVTRWILARMIGDAALEQAAESCFEDPVALVISEINILLDPEDPEAKIFGEIMQAHRK